METVTIKADGRPGGTRIYTPNGEDISHKVIAVSFRHEVASTIPVAELELAFISIEAVDVPVRMVGPGGKEVRRIVYADGTMDVFGTVEHTVED